MPKPPTDLELKTQIWDIVKDHPKISARAIFETLKARAGKEGIKLEISERTISRVKGEFSEKTPEEKLRFGCFRWPKSMLSGALPWEAAQTLLELVHHLRERGAPHPTVSIAIWFWRITLAAPTISIAERADLAFFMKSLESDPDPDTWTRGVEEYLIRSPWKSKRAKAAYVAAVRAGEIVRSMHKRWADVPAAFARVEAAMDSGSFQAAIERKVSAVREKIGREPTVNEIIEWEERKLKKIRKEHK
ncbi:MAG: hypothetical protein HY647_03935 [Acidobacteria bacterium]|nr:hypothetical protein [Acidobacteriota bacterium]